LIRRANQPPSSPMRGGLLAGEAFTMQLFGGRAGLPEGFLTPIYPTTTFRTADGAGFIVPADMTLTIPGVPTGQRARLQLRTWDNRGGGITNWLQVEADPAIARGTSLAFTSEPLGGVYVAPPNLAGLGSFSLSSDANAQVTRIQFVPDGHPCAPGYQPDTGQVFGARGMGLAYGWTTDHSQVVRGMESTNASDERFINGILANIETGATWELAVANGPYRVRLVAAVPITSQEVAAIAFEGTPVQSVGAVPGFPWQEVHSVTWVTDGRLTVSGSGLSAECGLCFMEVRRLPMLPELLSWTSPMPSTSLYIQLRGIAGMSYEIQTSTNLSAWSRLGEATPLEWDLFNFTDGDVAGVERRFYRALVLYPH
jgi:hypothetical protein